MGHLVSYLQVIHTSIMTWSFNYKSKLFVILVLGFVISSLVTVNAAPTENKLSSEKSDNTIEKLDSTPANPDSTTGNSDSTTESSDSTTGNSDSTTGNSDSTTGNSDSTTESSDSTTSGAPGAC